MLAGIGQAGLGVQVAAQPGRRQAALFVVCDLMRCNRAFEPSMTWPDKLHQLSGLGHMSLMLATDGILGVGRFAMTLAPT
jgi:hypothetical protein